MPADNCAFYPHFLPPPSFLDSTEEPASTPSSAKLPSFLSVGDSANRSAIKRIDERFGDSVPLAIDGRVLVHEGVLNVINEKGSRKKREFFLFNDVLVYAKKKLGRLGKKHLLPLDNLGVISVMDDAATDTKNVFHIMLMSSTERLTVCADSSAEKHLWIEQITNCVSHAVTSWQGELKDVDTGHIWAPLWQSEGDMRLCTLCLQTRFSLLHRKHHCSMCGLVVCGSCSPHTVPIARSTAIGASLIRKRSAPASNDDLSGSSSTLYSSNAAIERSNSISSQLTPDDSENVYMRVCTSCMEKGINPIAGACFFFFFFFFFSN